MPSIGVLEHFQKPTDKPSRRIKKAGGHSLVNRGAAIWIRENVLLQMLDVDCRQLSAQPYANLMGTCLQSTPNACRRPYIPEKLPANIDAMLGVIDQTPALTNQVRFRHA